MYLVRVLDYVKNINYAKNNQYVLYFDKIVIIKKAQKYLDALCVRHYTNECLFANFPHFFIKITQFLANFAQPTIKVTAKKLMQESKSEKKQENDIQITYVRYDINTNNIYQVVGQTQSTFGVQTMRNSIEVLQECYSSEEEQYLAPNQIKKSSSMLATDNACNSFKKYMYNIKYNIVHSDLMPIASLQRKAIQITEDSEPAYLLGNEYQYTMMQEFLQRYRSIIWLSYRANKKIGKSDVGWGCMIRVIQMVLAEVLQRNNPQAQLSQIIALFKQGQHVFSLDNICSVGKIKQRWTGSNEVLSIICGILQKQSLKVNKSISKHSIRYLIQPQIYYNSVLIKNTEAAEKQLTFPRMISISTKIEYGNNQTLPNQFLDHIKYLMKIQGFCGMVGGVSSEALYIVGYHEDKVIILDPHYIQDETEETEAIRYFKKTPRGIPFNKLSPSISFCFFFRDIDEYRMWASEICYSQRIYSSYKVFEVETLESEDIEKYRKRSEDFEVL